VGIPVLFIFTKDADKMHSLYERLIGELSGYSNINILYLNYDIGIEEINFGLEWLSDNMKPL
jgi:hypothetical protein